MRTLKKHALNLTPHRLHRRQCRDGGGLGAQHARAEGQGREARAQCSSGFVGIPAAFGAGQ